MNLGDKKPGKTPTKRPLYVYYIICRCHYRSSEYSGCACYSGEKYRKKQIIPLLLKVWKRAM